MPGSYAGIPLVLQPSPRNENSEYQDLIIVADSSGSITPENFLDIMQIILMIAESMCENTKFNQVGVIQFSTEAKIIVPLSPQPTTGGDGDWDLAKKVKAMKQKDCGHWTNVNTALALCRQMFTECGRTGNKKQVWIITDGAYSPNPTDVASALRRDFQCTITTLGIGKYVTLPGLDQTSSFDRSFLRANYQEALDFVKTNCRPKLSNNLKFTIRTVEDNHKIGHDVALIVKIVNEGKDPLPADCCLHFAENAYFDEKLVWLPAIASNGECTFSMTLPCKGGGGKGIFQTYVHHLPRLTSFKVYSKDGTAVPTSQVGLKFNAEHFTADFYAFETCEDGRAFNVLMFGAAGVGKSSLVNSIFSMLGPEVVQPAIVREDAQAVTKKLGLFDTERFKALLKGKLPLQLYDCPGIRYGVGESGNYGGQELELILDGIMPFNINIDQTETNYSDLMDKRDSAEVEAQRKIDVVMIVLEARYDDPEVFKRYKELIKRIQSHGRQVVVGLTRILDIEDDPAKRKDKVESMTQKLGVTMDLGFGIENYGGSVASGEKNFEADILIMAALHKIMSCAVVFRQTGGGDPIFRRPGPVNPPPPPVPQAQPYPQQQPAPQPQPVFQEHDVSQQEPVTRQQPNRQPYSRPVAMPGHNIGPSPYRPGPSQYKPVPSPSQPSPSPSRPSPSSSQAPLPTPAPSPTPRPRPPLLRTVPIPAPVPPYHPETAEEKIDELIDSNHLAIEDGELIINLLDDSAFKARLEATFAADIEAGSSDATFAANMVRCYKEYITPPRPVTPPRNVHHDFWDKVLALEGATLLSSGDVDRIAILMETTDYLNDMTRLYTFNQKRARGDDALAMALRGFLDRKRTEPGVGGLGGESWVGVSPC